MRYSNVLLRFLKLFSFALAMVLSAAGVRANDLNQAPASFSQNGARYVPIDIQTMRTEMIFDIATKKASGIARFEFVTEETGRPLFDVVPAVSRITLDGVDLNTSQLLTVKDPDQRTVLRSVDVQVDEGIVHVLTIHYDIKEGISFDEDTLRVGFFMSDLEVGGRNYWELFGVANLEYDRHPHIINARIVGGDGRYALMTNGDMAVLDGQHWEVTYPAYFNCSSVFFHIIDKDRFHVESQTYDGIAKSIEVRSYALEEDDATEGLRQSLAILRENEATYGAYPHDQALAFITPDGGGMEYGGATMTSIWALKHEFTHFWFARGVMPADGNAAWIDEAIASWRDDRYPRFNSGRPDTSAQLSGFPIYHRHTVMPSYTHGSNVIAALDGRFADLNVSDGSIKGMRSILRALFAEYQRSTITVTLFQDFIERVTSTDLDQFFQRYVFTRGLEDTNGSVSKHAKAHHPRPYTKAEHELYR